MSGGFYAVGVLNADNAIEVRSVFEVGAAAAVAKAEVGLADGERILWIRSADDDVASQIADAFNAGHALGMADAQIETDERS